VAVIAAILFLLAYLPLLRMYGSLNMPQEGPIGEELQPKVH
jgi:hypothetical protein